jgi:hypothetical protein
MLWRDFKTQADLRAAIRKIISEQPFKEPFESALISDLIVERHYFCSKRNLRPLRFRKIPGYGPKRYSFEGDFSGLSTQHSTGWHRVSWEKCIKPPVSDWDRIVRAMRDRVEPQKRQYRDEHPFCKHCSVAPSDEVHHNDPAFQTIAAQVRDLVSDEDIVDCLGSWDWFNKSHWGQVSIFHICSTLCFTF